MTCGVNIGLNPSVPQIYCILEGFKRVFVRNIVATSVGDCKWEYMLSHISSRNQWSVTWVCHSPLAMLRGHFPTSPSLYCSRDRTASCSTALPDSLTHYKSV